MEIDQVAHKLKMHFRLKIKTHFTRYKWQCKFSNKKPVIENVKWWCKSWWIVCLVKVVLMLKSRDFSKEPLKRANMKWTKIQTILMLMLWLMN